MRFVNYFNDAANAAVAFSFHRGFVAVSYLHVPKKREKKKKKEISCSNYCCLILFIPWFDAVGSSKWLIKVKSNKKKRMKILFLRTKKIDFIERENVYLSKAQDSIWFKDDRFTVGEGWFTFDECRNWRIVNLLLRMIYVWWEEISDKKSLLIYFQLTLL